MYRQLFANRWFALGFVAMTAIGAAGLVGTEGEGGLLDFATGGVQEQRTDFADAAAELSQSPRSMQTIEQPVDIVVWDDEVAVDVDGMDAAGFDPTPEPISADDPQATMDISDPAFADDGDPGIVAFDGAGSS